MKKIYIASPFRSDTEEGQNNHIDYARSMARTTILQGFDVEVPHLLYPQCLDDCSSEERGLGMGLAMNKLKGCDALLVCQKFGISEGMRMEIETAKAYDIKSIYVDDIDAIPFALDKM